MKISVMAFSVFSLLGFQVWSGKGYLCARKKMWEVEWLSVLIAPFYFSGKVTFHFSILHLPSTDALCRLRSTFPNILFIDHRQGH